MGIFPESIQQIQYVWVQCGYRRGFIHPGTFQQFSPWQIHHTPPPLLTPWLDFSTFIFVGSGDRCKSLIGLVNNIFQNESACSSRGKCLKRPEAIYPTKSSLSLTHFRTWLNLIRVFPFRVLPSSSFCDWPPKMPLKCLALLSTSLPVKYLAPGCHMVPGTSCAHIPIRMPSS